MTERERGMLTDRRRETENQTQRGDRPTDRQRETEKETQRGDRPTHKERDTEG